MKISEIMESASVGATSTGSVAVVNHALGQPLTRSGSNLVAGKYSTESTPNTPPEIKRYKTNVVGRFENSISH